MSGGIVAEAEQDGRSGGSFSARKPEQVAKEPRSYTGHYLAPLLTNPAHPEEQSIDDESASRRKPKKARRAAVVREREAAE